MKGVGDGGEGGGKKDVVKGVVVEVAGGRVYGGRNDGGGAVKSLRERRPILPWLIFLCSVLAAAPSQVQSDVRNIFLLPFSFFRF